MVVKVDWNEFIEELKIVTFTAFRKEILHASEKSQNLLLLRYVVLGLLLVYQLEIVVDT
jgi:hypothetical protein